MARRRSGAPLWNSPSSELVSDRVGRISRVGKDNGAGDSVTLQRTLAFFGAALLIFGQKVEGVAGERSFQFIAAKFASDFISILFQFQREVERAAVQVGGSHPASGDRGLGLGNHQTRS